MGSDPDLVEHSNDGTPQTIYDLIDLFFGDGAGATLLRATKSDRGVLASTIRSDGEGASFIEMPGGGSSNPPNRPEENLSRSSR